MIDQVNGDRMRQASKARGSKSFLSKWFILLTLLIVFVPLLSATSYWAYTSYRSSAVLGQTSAGHLQKAATLLLALQQQKSLDEHQISQAQQEFTQAFTGFTQLKSELQPWSAASLLPVYGSRVSSVRHLADMALGASQAGIAGCNLLNVVLTKLQNTVHLSTSGPGLTMNDMSLINQYVDQVETGLRTAIQEAGSIEPGDIQQLDSRIGKLLTTFRNEVPQIALWLGALDKLLPMLPTLLGVNAPANYLIEVLDSTEIRPGGGFIGNYGIATLAGGRLTSAHITDVELLDRPFEDAGRVIAYPPTYAWFPLSPASWSLRDSNLDADFPTAARYGEENYVREGGNIPVQGVIAVTPMLIKKMLAITGPIQVPEYHETITADNLIARIHYYQLSSKYANTSSDPVSSVDIHSSDRKRFIALLAEYFLIRLKQLPAQDALKVVQAAISAVHSKDIQIYLHNADAEQILQVLHLNGAIQAPPGDGLMIVDANVGGNKANSFITNIVSDRVTIDATGNATHQTTLTYSWKTPGPIYGSALYRDYLRIYVPPGSKLMQHNGWEVTTINQAFGSQVWGGFFTLSFDQTSTLALVWTVPGSAKKDAQGWHYQYLLQRQAGIERKLDVTIRLPDCATNASTWRGVEAQGKQQAALSQWFTEDVNASVDFIC